MDIDTELHYAISERAASMGMSINQFVRMLCVRELGVPRSEVAEGWREGFRAAAQITIARVAWAVRTLSEVDPEHAARLIGPLGLDNIGQLDIDAAWMDIFDRAETQRRAAVEQRRAEREQVRRLREGR